MNKLILIIIIIIASFALGFWVHELIGNTEKSNNSTQTSEVKKNTHKVKGIGGVFFKSKDPQNLKAWYKVHLDFDTDAYGTIFEWYQSADTSRKDITQWSLFSEKDSYFNPSEKEFMINYVVDDLPALITKLKREGVTLTDTMSTYDYGKFVHIMDPEGNKIELWEPEYGFGKKK